MAKRKPGNQNSLSLEGMKTIKICKTINAAKNATKGSLAATQSVPGMKNLKKDWKR